MCLQKGQDVIRVRGESGILGGWGWVVWATQFDHVKSEYHNEVSTIDEHHSIHSGEILVLGESQPQESSYSNGYLVKTRGQ